MIKTYPFLVVFFLVLVLFTWIFAYWLFSCNFFALSVSALIKPLSSTIHLPIKGNVLDNKYNPKVIILNFYDNPESQYINAKSILDKYGLKGTFFVVCNWIDSNHSKIPRMTWNEINQLHQEGHDIESHTMNHIPLTDLSSSKLDYEIGAPKQCLLDHHINSTVFSPPHSYGWDNITIIKTISKYYDHSIGGFKTPMFLDCHGWILPKKFSSGNDCRTFLNNGTLNFSNRYDIKETSHDALNIRYMGNLTKIYNAFVNLVDNSVKLNYIDGHIVEIPIIGYHDIDNNKTKDSTSTDLFNLEMKYLYDNGFKAIRMSDLLYNNTGNTFYIRDNID